MLRRNYCPSGSDCQSGSDACAVSARLKNQPDPLQWHKPYCNTVLMHKGDKILESFGSLREDVTVAAWRTSNIRGHSRPRSAKISVGLCFPFTATSPSRRVRYRSRAPANVEPLIMMRAPYSGVFVSPCNREARFTPSPITV